MISLAIIFLSCALSLSLVLHLLLYRRIYQVEDMWETHMEHHEWKMEDERRMPHAPIIYHNDAD